MRQGLEYSAEKNKEKRNYFQKVKFKLFMHREIKLAPKTWNRKSELRFSSLVFWSNFVSMTTQWPTNQAEVVYTIDCWMNISIVKDLGLQSGLLGSQLIRSFKENLPEFICKYNRLFSEMRFVGTMMKQIDRSSEQMK